MKDIDLRHLGTIFGLNIYVDVSSVKDIRYSRGSSDRDRQAAKVRDLLLKALNYNVRHKREETDDATER